MIILVPVFFPSSRGFGIDPLHYGVLVVAALGLGLFVPPFGVGFFIACALGRTTVEGAARAYVPYVVVLLIGLLLVAFVPWITLVVPRPHEALSGRAMLHELRAHPDELLLGILRRRAAARA